ncbi:uracil-DNA glycosylase [Limnobacter parvus]|uniref:Type-4 uracil-DNA glycosylase n=1 Tax=Limnobacter parvus TaxID=2939690 RepID=A0ABT1XL18_9BURK|nr:uracil-DNA glycosylase [Limnobacter parvus]MCR2747564.1 uracil-DNA glycosylase [Limnobacter parvus]
MTQSKSKAELFTAMGIGPVWELKNSPLAQADSHSDSHIKPTSAQPSLESLRSTVASCRACDLCETRKQTVFSDGVAQSHLMIVGEAPGAEEDETGMPFVGRAGQLLDRMLNAVDRSRKSNVYIANVLKCRPPGNRDPHVGEIEKCSDHLFQQIALNNPKVLLLVGRFSIQTLLNTKKSVGELRGKVHHVTLNGLNIPAIVTYHPAYLLRRPEEKSKAWDDLLLLKKLGIQ